MELGHINGIWELSYAIKISINPMICNFLSKSCFARNKILIGGNWKSNNTLNESLSLVNNTINTLAYDASKVDVVIAPINLHTLPVQKALTHPNVRIAAQNSSNYGFGAYTGEVSAKHLKDAGLEWVILGHSERRTLFKETDELIVSKTKHALEAGLKVIYCFGETLEGNYLNILERKGNKHWDVLNSQLTPILAAIPSNSDVWTENIVLAYEPVWAIGTGVSSSPEQTLEVFTWLRERLAKDLPQSTKVRIIYGGSANGKNAKDYLSIQSVDGLLVGGASLKPEFAEMVTVCNNVF